MLIYIMPKTNISLTGESKNILSLSGYSNEIEYSDTTEIQKIKNEMENAIDSDYNFSVPLVVDANSAKNWNDAH